MLSLQELEMKTVSLEGSLNSLGDVAGENKELLANLESFETKLHGYIDKCQGLEITVDELRYSAHLEIRIGMGQQMPSHCRADKADLNNTCLILEGLVDAAKKENAVVRDDLEAAEKKRVSEVEAVEVSIAAAVLAKKALEERLAETEAGTTRLIIYPSF